MNQSLKIQTGINKTGRSASPRSTEPTSRSEATKEMIITAARKVFVKYPFHKASIRMIAKEGGFHFSLINHYFTKSQLFGAVASQVSEEMIREFSSWFTGLQDMKAKDGFSLFLDRALDHFFKQPDLLMILMKNAGEAGAEETAPAFAHFSRYVFIGGDIIIKELRMESGAENIVVWFYGVLNLLINLVGAAPYHCQVLNMDPKGKEFRKWIKQCLMYLFTPTLKALFSKMPASS